MTWPSSLSLILLLPFSFLFADAAFAADIYVDQDASGCSVPFDDDYNPLSGSCGSGSATIYSSINSAANAVSGNNTTVYVRAGTYEETVVPVSNGSPGNFITYAAYPGETVIVRGWNISGRSYLRIIGFEITHGTTWTDENYVIYGNDMDHCEILNNTIHDTDDDGQGQAAIWMHQNSSNNFNIIRGNIFYNIGNRGVAGDRNGAVAIKVVGNYNIVEYNDIRSAADFTNVFGEYNIVRNNYFHDVQDADFPDYGIGENGHHLDPIQSWTDAAACLRYTVFEFNTIADFPGLYHGHGLSMLRDISTCGMAYFIARYNVVHNVGAYVHSCFPMNYTYLYNNTVVEPLRQHHGANYANAYSSGSIGHVAFNNIYYDAGDSSIYAGSGSWIDDYDCHYNSGDPEQDNDVAANPNFNGIANDDFTIPSSSPCRSMGTPITQTLTDYSGISFNVPNGHTEYLCDGYGIVAGDVIIVGANSAVEVNALDHTTNTITVSSSISGSRNDEVYLSYNASIADAGAFPYRPGGYAITSSISSPRDGSNVNGTVTITNTVNDPGLVRFVEFWIDGIPVLIDSTNPYRFDWNTSTLETGTSHIIKTIARPFFADKSIGYIDEATVVIGDVYPGCGDGICNDGENCENCPDDCPTDLGAVCCSGTTFTGDCCGDGDCDTPNVCEAHLCSPPCSNGERRPCYEGANGTEGVGECRAGNQTCESGRWGECEDQVLPIDEVCGNGLDNDCDGLVDSNDTNDCSSQIKRGGGSGGCWCDSLSENSPWSFLF